MLKIENAIATAFEHLELVIQAFDKARRLQVHKVVSDLIPVPMQSGAEGIEDGQARGLHLRFPLAQLAFSDVFGRRCVENVGEAFA